MFRPNSPSPPSGTTSTAGAACGSFDTDIGIPARLLTWMRRRGRAPTGEGARAPVGHRRLRSPTHSNRRSGRLGPSGGRGRVARTIAQARRDQASASAEYSTSCRVSGRRLGSMPAARRTAPASRPSAVPRAFRALPMRLAPLRERGADQPRHLGGTGHPGGRGRKRSRTTRRPDRRRRAEGAGWQREKRLDVGPQRGEQRQHAVVAGPGSGRAAGRRPRPATSASRRDQRRMGRRHLEQPEQDGRRHVVREVADHPDRPLGRAAPSRPSGRPNPAAGSRR